MKNSEERKVVIVGATGLVGSHLLKLLLKSSEVTSVTSLVRRKTLMKHSKLDEIEIDFESIHEYENIITGTAVFCCLGTTIKKAKTKENFKRVDYLYPLEIAKAARDNLVPQFHIITAIGADATSHFFYNKVKGEIEDALQFLHFDVLNIYRPSLLIGDREETRITEKIGMNLSKLINPIMIGSFKKYRGIQAASVAKAMLKVFDAPKEGINIFESDEIYNIAHDKIFN